MFHKILLGLKWGYSVKEIINYKIYIFTNFIGSSFDIDRDDFAIKAKEFIRVIEKLGFYCDRQKGSHAIYKNLEGLRVVVPIHSGIEKRSHFHFPHCDCPLSSSYFW